MAIHVHRAERTDRLAEALGELLAAPPADPFTPDLVAVPTPGIERFLTQTLGRRLGTSGQPGRSDGVCANVDFPSPVGLVEAVLAAGPEGPVRPDDDAWRPARSVWPLLGAIDEAVHEPWCQTLARHLGAVPREDGWDRSTRRFAVASRLAWLFHAYGSQRPALILDWAAGRDTDGVGAAVDADQSWQPALWRRLRAAIDRPSPAERLDAACRAVAADPSIVDLPDRLSVFGASRLPADQLRTLQALARGREVHLWLADPSPALWQRLAGVGAPTLRGSDSSTSLVEHPLLRSLGRDSRELGIRLAPLAAQGGTDEHLDAASPPRAGTLLTRLQADLSADRRPQADLPNALDPADRSVQVHGCHGPARQVEVLREALLTLLQEDPTLQPRDILVMCPDLASFAPLLDAAFTATGPGTPLADLRIRIADRSPEQDNDVLTTLGVVLDLVTGRMLRSELLDLMARAPVRTRFRLTDDQVERLEQLAVAVGVRWGLDGRTRSDFGLAGIDTGTWSWGLDRLLLGVALAEDALPLVGGVLPYDDVSTNDIALLGALAEVVGRVAVLRDASTTRAPLATWTALLSDTVTALMDARGPESWQLPHALAALAGLARNAGTPSTPDRSAADRSAADRSAGDLSVDLSIPKETPRAGPDLSLADVRWLLADVLAGRPTRSNFRSGGLTVCGLLPMRSVPHRVICLVGLDDGGFPRSPVPDGDDVLARRPCLGERDPRSEDRQVLLDAIMAATDHLVITYTAADDRTNAPSPPCVPLGELLDALDATVTLPDGRPAREQVVALHPLQPFDARSFVPEAPWGQPFSHDADHVAGARAGLRPRLPRSPLAPTDALPTEPVTAVEVSELATFLGAPAAWFLRRRIGVPVSRPQELPGESLPVDLDGLGRWGLGDRILDLVGRGGHGTGSIAQAERARGGLPPGQLGDAALHDVGPKAEAVAQAVAAAQGALPARLVSVAVALASGRRVHGTVSAVHGTTLVRGTYSKADARQFIRLWPALLALAASDEAHRYSAVVVGSDQEVRLAAPPTARARELIDELLDLLEAGSASPLPLYTRTSATYAKRRREGKSTQIALMLADRCWRTERFPGECASPDAVALYGAHASIDLLVEDPPLLGEAWFADEPRRFGQLSRRLWDPIHAAVEQGAADRLAATRAGAPS